jgi:hypothetical protein
MFCYFLVIRTEPSITSTYEGNRTVPMASTSTSLQATSSATKERIARLDLQTPERDTHNLGGDGLRSTQSSLTPSSKPASRTCRICFDKVPSIIDPASGQPSHENPNSANDRLLRPCKCSGSQRYVHESCLHSYRTHNLLQDSYVKCPTCGYSYRLETSPLRGFLTHSATQVLATTTIVALSIFTGGYAAIPLLSLAVRFRQTLEYGVVVIPWYTADRGWLDHFAQGAVLVGLTGVVAWLCDVVVMLWTRVWHPPIWFMVFLGLFS